MSQQPPTYQRPHQQPPAPVPGQPPQYQAAPLGQDPPGSYLGRPLAVWGKRAAATLVDGLVYFALSLPGWILYGIGVGVLASAQDSGAAGLGGLLSVVGILLAYGVLLGASIWQGVFVQGRTGQTWGKRALRIRLVSMQTGQPLGPGTTFVRQLCHFVDSALFYVGYLFPLWDPLRQTFADKIMKTVVLDEG